MINQEVVITGMGLTTASAHSPKMLFERIKSGKSCIKVHEKLARLGFPNSAAAVLDQDIWNLVNTSTANDAVRHTRLTRLALFTAKQALTQSTIELNKSYRAGVFMGSNWLSLDVSDLMAIGGLLKNTDSRIDLDSLHQNHQQRNRHRAHYDSDCSPLTLAQQFGFLNIVMGSTDACAAGSISVGTAYRHIRHGELDVALAGGSELLCGLLPFVGFNAIGISYSRQQADPGSAFRPFDRDRSGFVLGEGSAFLVMESAEHASARGAKPLARIAGFAKYAEANNVLASAANGSEFARCMNAALADANLLADDIDHINAHGTATLSNDACEAKAIKQVFGKRSRNIPVTASKSFVGHCFAASGVIEAVLSVLSLQEGLLLPTLNYETPDTELPVLDIVTRPRPASLRTVMSNSFALGGENCSLILAKA